LHFLLYTPRAFADVLSSVQAAHTHTQKTLEQTLRFVHELKSSSNSIERRPPMLQTCKTFMAFSISNAGVRKNISNQSQKKNIVFLISRAATIGELQIDKVTTLVDSAGVLIICE
jgi:hypothetical protein